MAMGAGLRPTAKALEWPPDPTVRAPVLYPTSGLEHAGGVGMSQRVGSHRLADARLGHGQLAGLLQGGRVERHVLGLAREKMFRPLAENRCLLAVVWL